MQTVRGRGSGPAAEILELKRELFQVKRALAEANLKLAEAKREIAEAKREIAEDQALGDLNRSLLSAQTSVLAGRLNRVHKLLAISAINLCAGQESRKGKVNDHGYTHLFHDAVASGTGWRPKRAGQRPPNSVGETIRALVKAGVMELDPAPELRWDGVPKSATFARLTGDVAVALQTVSLMPKLPSKPRSSDEKRAQKENHLRAPSPHTETRTSVHEKRAGLFRDYGIPIAEQYQRLLGGRLEAVYDAPRALSMIS